MIVTYDKYYQTENLFGEPYPELVAFFAKYPQKGKVLDLGCEQGRDSIPLARMGAPSSEESVEDNGVELLNIYPNPFRQQFMVDYVLEDKVSELILEVYDLQSRLLITEIQKETISGRMQIDFSCCADGTYICKVMADGKLLETQRIVHSR